MAGKFICAAAAAVVITIQLSGCSSIAPGRLDKFLYGTISGFAQLFGSETQNEGDTK